MKTKPISELALPPYGILSRQYKDILKKDWDKPMCAWKHKEDWPTFRDKTIANMADHLWPALDYDKLIWKGASIDHCVDAIDAELAIMQAVYQKKNADNQLILDLLPSIDNSLPDKYRNFTHRWHFEVEDGVKKTAQTEECNDGLHNEAELSANQGGNYTCYNASINPDLFHEQWYGNLIAKLDGLFDYKVVFSRPRPYQSALMLGHTGFDSHVGDRGTHKGVTPSMISGHCLQGILLSCKALEIWIKDGTASSTATDSLAQYAAEFGDRRVFAGVHYPTDNISSWVLSLEIIPHIFDHADQIMEFALLAITQKSHVFQTVQAHFPGHASLNPALEYLNGGISGHS